MPSLSLRRISSFSYTSIPLQPSRATSLLLTIFMSEPPVTVSGNPKDDGKNLFLFDTVLFLRSFAYISSVGLFPFLNILCEEIVINYSARLPIILSAIVLSAGVLILPDVVKQGACRSLILCGTTLIPSIFPYMVATNLLISCDFDKTVKRLIERPFRRIFHINGSLASAYIIGSLAGYPQGAAAITAIYEKGGCSKKEAEHALTFCNNTGPAFIIAGIGGMLKSTEAGVKLFLVQSLIALLYAIITRPKDTSYAPADNCGKSCEIGFDIIPRAVTQSVLPMLNICGFVILFGTACSFITELPVSETAKATLLSVLELTNATDLIVRTGLGTHFLAFSVVWSGICVHMQTYSIVKNHFSMRKYILGKLIQGLSAGLFFFFS